MMDRAKQKEQFSIAYVNAMAAQAGLNNGHCAVDDDSVDLMLLGKGFDGKIRNPQLQLQLKCTSQQLVKDEVIKFPLSVKNYNDLRGENVVCPRYLVVLVVPENVADWSEQRSNELILRNSCYWMSIRNMPETCNVSSVTVEVPLKQQLTKEILLELMAHASKGEAL